MDKDFVLEMANIIKDQLVGMTPLNVICSWGIGNFVATEYKGMAALKFQCIGEEVYFDELGCVIDEAVERGKDEAEYRRFLLKECFS